MGRKANVERSEAIAVVKEYIEHFLTKKLPEYTSEVWKKMSASLQHKWSAHNVYINVREDRRSILTAAREELGIFILPEKPQHLDNEKMNDSDLLDENANNMTFLSKENDSTFSSDNDTEKIDNTVKFEVVLSQKHWDDIKPDCSISGHGRKPVLKEFVWSNILAAEFWKQHRLNCAYVFKRADVKISSDGLSYDIKIVGRCKSTACSNTFTGRATKNRFDTHGLIIEVLTRDTRGEKHEEVKRPFNGKRRKDAQKELIAEGCAVWKKRQARENMETGDLVPPFLPSDDVLRQARKEGVDAQLKVQPSDARDLIRTIEELPANREYAGLIQAVGSLPFYVFYGSPAQLHAYNEYCRIMKGAAVINIDATGSLVTKLTRPNDKRTGHIFLYCIVINFDKTTLPVYQMLSEKHDAEFIQYWIQQWIRLGARKPREAICDRSRALMSAMCMAFNNITIKSYINKCFASVQDSRQSIDSLSTYIRIDVAHLIHSVCRWKSFKTVRQSSIKDFFVRCVALMIECQTLSEFAEVFMLTCVVGLQECDDAVLGFPQARSTKEARKVLEDSIATRSVNIQFVEQESETTENSSPDSESVQNTGSPIEQWVKKYLMLAKNPIGTGTELNPFFLPDFIEELSRLAMEFPIWTNVTLPYMAPHATSSYVEGYFNDLKTRVLKDHPKSMRVDKFVKKHATDIEGGTLLFTSKITNFEHRGESVPMLPPKTIHAPSDSFCMESYPLQYNAAGNDSDLLSQENWRAKAVIRDIESDIESLQDETHRCTYDVQTKTRQESKTRERELSEDELEWSQTQIEGTVGLISPNLKILDASIVESIFFDHSYSKINELNSTPRVENMIKNREISENIDEDFHPEMQPPVDDVTICAIESQPETQSPVDSVTAAVTESQLKTQSTDEGMATAATESFKPEKTKSKFFKPFPEVRQLNLLTRKSKKPSLIPNGSLCQRPVKIGNNSYFVRFTCAFDSLTTIVMMGAIDDVHYNSVVERSENPTFQFVSSLLNKGVTAAVLLKRGVILKNFCPSAPTTQTGTRVVSWTLNAWNSIENVVKHTFNSVPSIVETHTCSTCPRRQFNVPVISVNHQIISKHGFGLLEKALDFRSRTYNIRCYDPCTGHYTLDKNPNVHLFIELDVREVRPGWPAAKSGMHCKLEQLPAIIRLSSSNDLDIEYRLTGVVGYKNEHYTAYCRRVGGNWQKFDDMQRDVSICVSNTTVEPHLAVYIRQYWDKCEDMKCPCNSRY